MENSEFQRMKQQIAEMMWPQKTLNLNELAHKGENVYAIGGKEIAASESFTKAYDRVIGINKQQTEMVKAASGETGLTNYRNYINVASSMQKPRSVVVIASPVSRELTDIVPLVDAYIPPSLFFDFAEMMVEETGFTVSDIKFDQRGRPRMTLTYTNPQSRPHSFGTGEDFLMDGFYLAWTPSQVELGHYYERLVCSNGQTVKEEHMDTNAYRLSPDEVRKMIDLVKHQTFLVNGIEQFGQLLTRAAETRISLSEMGRAQRLLIAEGVDKEQAEVLIPYESVRASYERAGYRGLGQEHLMKGEGTIWDTYNTLTQFASHTPIWGQQDLRRISVMDGAVGLLKRKPDIVNYIDIY